MDLVTAILAIAGSIIAAVVLKLVSSEIEAWLPNLTRFLIDQATKRLPEHEQERRLEEWLADNDDFPGKLAKLFRALGYLWASYKMPFGQVPDILLLPGNHDSVGESSPSAGRYLSLEQLFEKFVTEVDPSEESQSIKSRMREFVHPDVPLDDPNWDEFVSAVKSCSNAIRAAGWKTQSP